MAKSGINVSLFYDANERAKKLETEYFDLYQKLYRHMLNQEEDFIRIDILLSYILDDLEEAQRYQKSAKAVVGKVFPDYLRKLSKTIPFEEEYEKKRQHDYEKFVFSGIWYTICAFLVVLFLKELLTDHFLINYYIDMAVAAAALYLAASNLYQHVKIIKRWRLDRKSLVMEIVGLIVSVLMMIFTLKSPFDMTFIILVVTYLSSKKLIKTAFEQVLS